MFRTAPAVAVLLALWLPAGPLVAEPLTFMDATGASIAFEDAELLALPQVELETSTIWTVGVSHYSGPSLRAVLDHVEAGQGPIELTALNDYRMVIDPALIEEDYPILAMTRDGEPMGRRDKGPFWVMFPFDADARYRSEAVYAASVWQLTGIHVGPAE